MRHSVTLTLGALNDLCEIYEYIAEAAGEDVADGFDRRIRVVCLGLAHFPRRGTPRDEIMPGLRSVPFERSATIFYLVGDQEVEIVRILYRGRDITRAFANSG